MFPKRMALQAELVDLRPFEHVRVGGPVREMADGAALGLDGHVLIDEGALLVGVALEADLILIGRPAQRFGQEAAVLVVAVVAHQQPLLNAMVERP